MDRMFGSCLMGRLRLIGLGLALSGLVPVAESAAGPASGEIDPTFRATGLVAGDFVIQLLVQEDGRILVGKQQLDLGRPSQRLVRLLPDGARDVSFAAPDFVPPAPAADDLIAMQGAKIVVAGEISAVNGVRVDRVARLNPDGSPDTTFNGRHGLGEFVWIQNLAVGSGGELYLSGVFSGIEGNSPEKVVKLTPNGEIDVGFRPRLNLSGSGLPYSLLAEPEGTLLVGGDLAPAGGTSAPGLVRLARDGGLLRDFSAAFPFDATATALAMAPDGRRLMAGFSLGMRLIRFRADGAVDPDFDIGRGPDGDIHRLKVLPDGRILAGGGFFRWSGQPRQTLALLLPDGRLDPDFQPQLPAGSIVRADAIQGVGRVLVGGQIRSGDGSTVEPLVALVLPALAVQAPQVVSGPRPQEMEEGDNVFLRVEASGFPRRAQWFRDGQPIPGATNESYIRFGVGKAEAGTYSLKLSNDAGTVTTEPVSVTVFDAPAGANLIPNPGFEILKPAVDPTSSDAWPAMLWNGFSSPGLWSYPEKIPLNYQGTEDVLQGTNYACVYGITMDFGDGPRLVQEAGLEATLTGKLEPDARYELTGWLSRADSSVTPDPGVKVSLRAGTDRSLSAGTVTCSQSQGWTRFRTTVVPAAPYSVIRLTGTRNPEGETGFSGVFLDQLALRRIDPVSPEFAPVPAILLPPWEALVFTNALKSETVPDVQEDGFRFALVPGSAGGARVDPITGALYWSPTARDAGTQPELAVSLGYQSGRGPVATHRLPVLVQDGVMLELGQAWVNGSRQAVLPVTVRYFGRPDQTLGEVRADVSFPQEVLRPPELEFIDPSIEQGTLTPIGGSNYRLAFRWRAPGAARGSHSIALIGITATPSSETRVHRVLPGPVSATRADGSAVGATRAGDGVVRVVNGAPMLEITARSGSPVLRLYGREGGRYRIERLAAAGATNVWSPIREIVASAFPTEVPDIGSGGPADFFRAVNVP